MCIVIDTDTFGKFLGRKDSDLEPVWKWVNNKGKIAYCPTGKIKKEMKNYIKKLATLSASRELQRSNMVKLINAGKFLSEKEKLLNSRYEPKNLDKWEDDIHIIALAKAANVKVLVTGDKLLMEDFKNCVKRGKIYQYENHNHLLPKNGCP